MHFSLWKMLPKAFYKGFINLHPPPPCMSAPVSPQCCHRVMLSSFWNLPNGWVKSEISGWFHVHLSCYKWVWASFHILNHHFYFLSYEMYVYVIIYFQFFLYRIICREYKNIRTQTQTINRGKNWFKKPFFRGHWATHSKILQTCLFSD